MPLSALLTMKQVDMDALKIEYGLRRSFKDVVKFFKTSGEANEQILEILSVNSV